MNNFPSIPERFSIIDEKNWDEHYYIRPGDECFYIWERMSHLWRAGERPDYGKYPTNGFISNLQIPVACKAENPYRYKHKIRAIQYAARALSELLPGEWRDAGCFVPMPPSKVKGDEEYDSRLLKALKAVKPPLADIRELVLQRENADPKQKGLCPEDRAGNYYVNEREADPEPQVIFVVDDVLTTGCHFKAMKMVLADHFPDAAIYGVFLARAVRPQEEPDSSLI